MSCPVHLPVAHELNTGVFSTLDLSFNLVKHIPEELETHLTSLKTIFFVQNRISHIANLNGLAATLRSVELGGNRLRVRYKYFSHGKYANFLTIGRNWKVWRRLSIWRNCGWVRIRLRSSRYVERKYNAHMGEC